MLAVVERHVDGLLAAGEQQPAAQRIFADGVDRRAVGKALRDARPGLAAVARAVDVRAAGRRGGSVLIAAYAVLTSKCDASMIETFAHGLELRRRHVGPRLARRRA